PAGTGGARTPARAAGPPQPPARRHGPGPRAGTAPALAGAGGGPARAVGQGIAQDAAGCPHHRRSGRQRGRGGRGADRSTGLSGRRNRRAGLNGAGAETRRRGVAYCRPWEPERRHGVHSNVKEYWHSDCKFDAGPMTTLMTENTAEVLLVLMILTCALLRWPHRHATNGRPIDTEGWLLLGLTSVTMLAMPIIDVLAPWLEFADLSFRDEAAWAGLALGTTAL